MLQSRRSHRKDVHQALCCHAALGQPVRPAIDESARPSFGRFLPTLTCRRCLPVRPLCRTKRSHEDDEADKEAHRRKRVRRNAYTGKLKKRSPEAIAAVAAELQKQDRM